MDLKMQTTHAPDEVAALLHVDEKTLYRWRKAGEGPAFIRSGRKILYLSGDIEAYLESRRSTPATS